MTPFQAAAAALTLTALVGWINARTIKLQQSVVMFAAGLLCAGGLFVVQKAVGPSQAYDSGQALIASLNFPEAVLGYMLAFLLFAGGMQVDLGEFRKRRAAIWSLATLGVFTSTALVTVGVWGAARLLKVDLPWPWALVFAALISPTDPIATLASVRQGDLSKSLGAILQGEALFNDGVGLVIFTAALALLGGAAPDPGHAALAIVVQAGGGLALGLGGAWIVILGMRMIDDYVVELTATFALAMGVYAMGEVVHVSGAIAAASAGLMLGSYGVDTAMSDVSERYIKDVWHSVDEVLNGIIFLLLGLQVVVTPFHMRETGLWAAAIALVLLARFIVVLPWGAWFRIRHDERGVGVILAWGGLRGALSLALALTLPRGEARDVVVAMTFAVVVASVMVQGLSFPALARRAHCEGSGAEEEEEPDAPAEASA